MIGNFLVDDCHPPGQQKKFRNSNALLDFAYGAKSTGATSQLTLWCER